MNIIAYLKLGSSRLDLNSLGVSISEDWTPPHLNPIPNIAESLGFNLYDGAEKVSTSFANRTMKIPIRVQSTTVTETNRVEQRVSWFMLQAGNPREPLELHYRMGNIVDYEPVVGTHGTDFVMTIIHASPTQKSNFKGDWPLRYREVEWECTCKPFIESKAQTAFIAGGGINIDRLGSIGHSVIGTRVEKAATNRFTNPVFGHSTPLTNWTSGTGVSATVSYDPEYCPGDVPACVNLTSDAAGTMTFFQSITCANTNIHKLHFIAKNRDGAEITTAQFFAYYGGVQLAEFRSLGDGFYHIIATVSGIVGATNAGLSHNISGNDFFVTAFMMEEANVETRCVHGDDLGCTWSGTFHASTSSRTGGVIKRASSFLNRAQGTFRLVVKIPSASALLPSGELLYFFDMTAGFSLRYWQSTQSFLFYVNIGSALFVSSAVTSWDSGEILVIHGTYGPATRGIYLNGVGSVTTTAHDYETLGTFFFLGSNSSGAAQCQGTILGFTYYDRQFTDDQVLDDYNNLATAVTSGQEIDPVFHGWNKDTDWIVDDCNDSSRENFMVINGVAGTAPAKTRIQYDPLAAGLTSYLNLHTSYKKRFRKPNEIWYNDLSGSADANASGAAYQSQTIVTTGSTYYRYINYRDVALTEGTTHFFARLKSTGSVSIQVKPMFTSGQGGSYFVNGTRARTIALTTAWDLFYIGSLNIEANGLTDESIRSVGVGVTYYSLSGTPTLHIDYQWAVSGSYVRVDFAGSATIDDIVLRDLSAMNTGASLTLNPMNAYGTPISFVPRQTNVLWLAGIGAHVITNTYQMNELQIIPRWQMV